MTQKMQFTIVILFFHQVCQLFNAFIHFVRFSYINIALLFVFVRIPSYHITRKMDKDMANLYDYDKSTHSQHPKQINSNIENCEYEFNPKVSCVCFFLHFYFRPQYAISKRMGCINYCCVAVALPWEINCTAFKKRIGQATEWCVYIQIASFEFNSMYEWIQQFMHVLLHLL